MNKKLGRKVGDAIWEASLIASDNRKDAADIALKVIADEIAAQLPLDASVLAVLRLLEEAP